MDDGEMTEERERVRESEGRRERERDDNLRTSGHVGTEVVTSSSRHVISYCCWHVSHRSLAAYRQQEIMIEKNLKFCLSKHHPLESPSRAFARCCSIHILVSRLLLKVSSRTVRHFYSVLSHFLTGWTLNFSSRQVKTQPTLQ